MDEKEKDLEQEKDIKKDPEEKEIKTETENEKEEKKEAEKDKENSEENRYQVIDPDSEKYKLTAKDIEMVFKDVEKIEINSDVNIVDMLTEKKICSSKREAREFVSAGTISINGERIVDLEAIISRSMTIEDKYLIVRRGKKNYYLGEKE